MDVFRRLLVTSDPRTSGMRKCRTAKKMKGIPPEVMNLLIPATDVNDCADSDVDDDFT